MDCGLQIPNWKVGYIKTCSVLSNLLLETLSFSSLALFPQPANPSLAQATTHTIFLESFSFISSTSYHILAFMFPSAIRPTSSSSYTIMNISARIS